VSTTEDLPTKRPRTRLAGPYGHPFHPVLVTVPIGAWVAVLIFDILARTSDANTGDFARGAFVLLLIGIVGAVIAALFGFMDLMTIPSRTPAAATALTHMALNTIILVVMAVNALVRQSEGLDSVSTTSLCLTILGLVILGVSGSLGGRLSYRYGVRVADEQTQAGGYRRSTALADDSAAPVVGGAQASRERRD
jgi:uncharacterized membrane protein